VYNTCIGMLQNIEDAEDVTQEIFVTIHLNVKDFKEEGEFKNLTQQMINFIFVELWKKHTNDYRLKNEL
jgi:DNA-directed RNA polymerase specialized sigma24 family protein